MPLISKHGQESRRRLSAVDDDPQLRRRLDAVQVGALYQGYGTHYIDLWVGSPPQRQTLIVDTGSGVTAFPCSACTDCGKGHHIDNYFNDHDSSTFKKLGCSECQRGHCQGSECHIGMSYQEGSSWGAFEAKDQVYIGGPHSHPLLQDDGGNEDVDPDHAKAFSFEMAFGCQTKLTGLFKTQLADGIMGMDNNPQSFWAQSYKHKIIDSQSFSLCFTRQPTADRDGTEAGAMTMGGFDERLHTSKMVYSSNRGAGGGFFNVRIKKVYLRHGSGGESARATDPAAQLLALNVGEDELNHGNVIVDSGTTDTYFTRRISSEFNAAYRQLSGKAYTHSAMALSAEELKNMPTILIQIGGDTELNKQNFPDPSAISGLAAEIDPDNPYDVIIAIPPSHYMEFDRKQKKYVARFYADEGSGSVIGANAMMGHDVFFDIDQQRVGWAESDCDYVELVQKAGFNKDGNGEGASFNTNDRKEANFSPDEGISQPGASSNVHPAVAACSDLTCRGGVAGIVVAFLIVGVVLGRSCSNRSSTAYHAAELELNDMTEDDDEFSKVRYRDEPVAAEEGVGYHDEPETPPEFT